MKWSIKVFAMSAVLGLAACGGGGDGAPAATATPLATTNYVSVAQVAVASVGASTVLGGVAPLAAQPTSPVVSWSDLASGDASAISRLMVRQLTKGTGGKARIAAVAEDVEECAGGGTLTYTVNDADGDQLLSAGDSVSVTAKDCFVEKGLPPVNGQLSIRINSLQLGETGEVIAVAFTLSVSNLESGDVSLDGAVDVSVNSDTFVLAYKNLTATEGTETVTFDFTQTETWTNDQVNVTVTGNLVINGSSYLLSTPVKLQAGYPYFSAGTLRVADRSGGYVDIVMSKLSYTINLYLPGDAVVDASETVSWPDNS